MAVLGTLTRLVHFAGALLRPAGRDESGVVAILAALLGTALIGGAALVEVSGGVTLATVRDYALPGGDVISVGALTHSAPAADLSLTVVGARR